MRFKTIVEKSTNISGVFIPMDDWNSIIAQFPEIEDNEITNWQKNHLNKRLEIVENERHRIKPIAELDL